MDDQTLYHRISYLLAVIALALLITLENLNPGWANKHTSKALAFLEKAGALVIHHSPSAKFSGHGKSRASLVAQNLAEADAPRFNSAPLLRPGASASIVFEEALRPRPVFHTTIPVWPRNRIITYTVQAGDTVFDIAARFGISPETIMWSNPELEENPDWLPVGMEVIILPVSGVYHTVKEGDTIESLAKKYKVKPSDITDYPLNNLQGPPYELVPGQKLVIPGGQKPYKPKIVRHYTGPIPPGAAKGTGRFAWPIDGPLYITQYYWKLHRAIDIGVPLGTPVYAADSGFVVYAGWNDQGYGKLVIIDHRNGFMTYYAHLSVIKVAVGMSVRKGQIIGLSGSTGRSTGPHLHFEIRKNGIPRNPLGFLH